MIILNDIRQQDGFLRIQGSFYVRKKGTQVCLGELSGRPRVLLPFKVKFSCLSLFTLITLIVILSSYINTYLELVSERGGKNKSFFFFSFLKDMKAAFLFTFQEGPIDLGFKVFKDQLFL